MMTYQKKQIQKIMQEISDKMGDENIKDSQYGEYYAALHMAEKILKVLGYVASYDNLNHIEIEKAVTK